MPGSSSAGGRKPAGSSAAAELVLQAQAVEAQALAQAVLVQHALHPVHRLALPEQHQRGQPLDMHSHVTCLGP